MNVCWYVCSFRRSRLPRRSSSVQSQFLGELRPSTAPQPEHGGDVASPWPVYGPDSRGAGKDSVESRPAGCSLNSAERAVGCRSRSAPDVQTTFARPAMWPYQSSDKSLQKKTPWNSQVWQLSGQVSDPLSAASRYKLPCGWSQGAPAAVHTPQRSGRVCSRALEGLLAKSS